jgi:hypothetical protein
MLPVRAIRRQYFLLGHHSCEVLFDLPRIWLSAWAGLLLSRMLAR